MTSAALRPAVPLAVLQQQLETALGEEAPELRSGAD
jgi:hypothetical protein